MAGIKHSAEQGNCKNNVIIAGKLSDQELSAAYSIANALIFPVLDLAGDVEGFGMVALEAAAHGLATIAFDSGGVSDAVKPGVTGQLVTPEDYPEMAEEIIKLLDNQTTPSEKQQCADYASEFSWPIFVGKLNRLCFKIIDNTNIAEPD